MSVTYFKRFRMYFDLTQPIPVAPASPAGYHFVPYHAGLLTQHAEAKYHSFRYEMDANIFPCLGQRGGCESLMKEIVNRNGFVAAATWLVVYQPDGQEPVNCGTVQGIRDRMDIGTIQNVGVVEGHRNQGLGRGLLVRALTGFREQGLATASLEVTAKNEEAVRLYIQFGFGSVEIVYKSIEIEQVG